MEMADVLEQKIVTILTHSRAMGAPPLVLSKAGGCARAGLNFHEICAHQFAVMAGA